MTTWYEYVCLDCGHGGLTKEPGKYRRGRVACSRCGSVRFEVQEQGLAPLPEEDESVLELEENDD